MSWEADLDAAAVTVLMDLRHPHSYLALEPAIAFGQSQGIELNWLPVATPTLRRPSTPGPDDDRGILHRRARAEALARGIEVYAEAQGLTIRDYHRDGDATAAHLGWLWVRHHHPDALVDWLRAVFRAYWAVELDPSEIGAVAKHVESVGGDGPAFREWAASDGVAIHEALARYLGDRSGRESPMYLVEDEVFLGRQHLPMIAWILNGREGPGPI